MLWFVVLWNHTNCFVLTYLCSFISLTLLTTVIIVRRTCVNPKLISKPIMPTVKLYCMYRKVLRMKMFTYLLSALLFSVHLYLKSEGFQNKANKITVQGLFVFPRFVFNKQLWLRAKHIFLVTAAYLSLLKCYCEVLLTATIRQTIQTFAEYQKLIYWGIFVISNLKKKILFFHMHQFAGEIFV